MVQSTEPNTGYQFAKYLISNFKDDLMDTQFYVHSLNPAGSKNIENLLKDHFQKVLSVPFFLLQQGGRIKKLI